MRKNLFHIGDDAAPVERFGVRKGLHDAYVCGIVVISGEYDGGWGLEEDTERTRWYLKSLKI